MNFHLMRNPAMNDENRSSNLREPCVRITRSRARALGKTAGLPPLHPSAKQDESRVLRANSKRAASDRNKCSVSSTPSPQHKKRDVLKDVTNVRFEDLYMNCITNGVKIQPGKQDCKGSLHKKGKEAPTRVAFKSQVTRDRRGNMLEEVKKVEVKEIIDSKVNLKVEPTECTRESMSCSASPIPWNPSRMDLPLLSLPTREDGRPCETEENLEDKDIIDIDSKHNDPLMCRTYAADIHSSWHVIQLSRRPSVDYMEKLQRDITQGMRAILIDWIVEVSEEYRLVPDTLYLTVNLVDRFLSENYIEKQKLQLLGVTCMLIASKYEEICAPRVEEFCFITDNTYSKEE